MKPTKTKSTATALDRLADLAGIEPRYLDIWGTEHRISAETKRILLAAMGIAAEDDEAVRSSASRLEDEPFQRPLPRVLVVRQDRPIEVPIAIPATPRTTSVEFELVEEGGRRHRFAIKTSEASLASSRTVDGRRIHRRTFRLPLRLPIGYHDLSLAGRTDQATRLIVAPSSCYLPDSLEDSAGTWGIAAHLYSLRSRRDWGIGDFTALAELADVAGRCGAGTIGLNPLHALFPQAADHASPYSPSSRLFLNPLYLDVERIPDFERCPDARDATAALAREIQRARAGDFVDYSAVAAIKHDILPRLFDCFARDRAASGDRSGDTIAFGRFREESGNRLRRFATFEALSQTFEGKPWQEWAEPYRHPDSPAVQDFADRHARLIEYHEFLQWRADQQLLAVKRRAEEAGVGIGLYRDLAVGVAPNGADAWSEQGIILTDASVGAPPDPFNMMGQDWGLPPLNPRALTERAYEPFVAMVRANMRHAGALRIDHVMGLLHLFWIPIGAPASQGGYVAYPFDDLLGILALESHRNRCLVIGEDLGTVPEGFRERMAEENVLSYRVLYFEKTGDRFKRPDEYPEAALACVTTHDLATLTGFWQGTDIQLKRRLGLYPSVAAEQNEWMTRLKDKRLLLEALHEEGLLPDGTGPGSEAAPSMEPELIAAVHGFLARSPAKLLIVQIDDITREKEQLNLPGTVDERPNWRRRLSLDIEELADAPVMKALRRVLADRSAGAERRQLAH